MTVESFTKVVMCADTQQRRTRTVTLTANYASPVLNRAKDIGDDYVVELARAHGHLLARMTIRYFSLEDVMRLRKYTGRFSIECFPLSVMATCLHSETVDLAFKVTVLNQRLLTPAGVLRWAVMKQMCILQVYILVSDLQDEESKACTTFMLQLISLPKHNRQTIRAMLFLSRQYEQKIVSWRDGVGNNFLHMIANAPAALALTGVIETLRGLGIQSVPNRRGNTPQRLADMRTDCSVEDLHDLCGAFTANRPSTPA